MECPKCQFENPKDMSFCVKCGAQLALEKVSIAETKTLLKQREELTTGSTFAGRYQVVEEMGRGGMGKVYKVIDTKLEEELALKIIHPEIAVDERIIKRFGNELKMARKISHKNVCRMYHLEEKRGNSLSHHGVHPGRKPEGYDRDDRADESWSSTIGCQADL